MIGDRKINLTGFEIYEYTALEQYLELMAKKGWFPTGIRHYLILKKGIPQVLTYRVEILPRGSIFDPPEDPEYLDEEYRPDPEIWTWRCGNGARTIYCALEGTPPAPQFLSETARFHAAAGQVFKRELPGYAVMLALITLFFFLLRQAAPGIKIAMAIWGLIFFIYLACQLTWYTRGRAALKAGKPVPPFSLSAKRRKDFIQGLLLALSIIIYLFSAREWRFLPYVAGYLGLLWINMMIHNLCADLSPDGRGIKRAAYFVTAFITSVIYVTVMHWLLYTVL